MQSIITSQFHDIEIQLTGWDEPNNGRTLRIANLIINGKNENAKYFDDWNRLNGKLDKVIIDSVDKRYVYIPAESGGFLIDTTNFNKIQLPYKSLSTLTFTGNFFLPDALVLIYTDELVVFDIAGRTPVHYKFPAGNLIWAQSAEDGELVVAYTDPETKNMRTEKVHKSGSLSG
jgi:hypothetical protein